ncbi:hypothetical protein SEA_BAZZLE_49 [Mycobacterium phage Bazzle]
MRASERLAERNDILEVIAEIDSELSALVGIRSFRAAQEAREKLDIRRGLEAELNALGFKAPELDERLKHREVTRSSAATGGDRSGGSGSGSVVAKRRIGPSPQAS